MSKPKKKDQRASNRMVRLPVVYHDTLQQAAKLSKRPVTWELQIALAKHFESLGLKTPPGPGMST